MQHSLSTQRGFTLLMASLVASVVIAIGAAIYTLAFKEVSLSATGRESQFAFYAADAGVECALYWDFRDDIHPDTFATSTQSSPAPEITCNAHTVPVTVDQSTETSATSHFNFSPATGRCAIVTVAKCTTTDNQTCDSNGATILTRIHADGFNNLDVNGGCAGPFPDGTLQRSVEASH